MSASVPVPPPRGSEGPPQDVVVLVNTKSRRGELWYEGVLDGLKSRGVTVRHAESFKKPAGLFERAKAAVAAGERYVILGGGDGTFSGSARFFDGSESVIGVLPLGTGNAFARDLGIKTDVDAACDVIAAGNVERVDMGLAGGKPFVNVATIGLTSSIARNLNPMEKRYLGPLAYGLSLMRSLARIRPFEATIELDGKRETFESLQVVVGNGRFHAGPFLLAPDADIASGELVAYGLNSTNKADFLRLGVALAFGRQLELENVVSLRGREGRIEAKRAQRYILDGEVAGATPFALGIKPGALRVLAPPAEVRMSAEGDEAGIEALRGMGDQ